MLTLATTDMTIIEEAELFKPVQVAQKIPFGVGTFIPSIRPFVHLFTSLDYVDPKTLLCVYYKAGHCDKGNKCKFSHDMNINRKVEKKDLYSDTREDKENGTLFLVIHLMLTIHPFRVHRHDG